MEELERENEQISTFKRRKQEAAVRTRSEREVQSAETDSAVRKRMNTIRNLELQNTG